ncbi:MAG TPA: ABC transporter permease subunit [Verrucomicrobiae bacterium]|jgi:oligopeptide transport system permease protein|nr:ABC transporter permease subunit [Verrucomicrobiae bacterium]
MLRFILKRILEAIPVLFIVATITFFLLHRMPGGPFDTERPMTPEVKKQVEAYYGLDKPVAQQYFNYMKRLVLHGDLGMSQKYFGWSVNELLAGSLPVSLELGLEGLLFALFFGLLAGIIASLRKNTASDYVPMSIATLGICIPNFVTGPLLILVFAIYFGQFNASGWNFPRDRILPAMTLGLYYMAYISRLTRGGMLEILNQDFIRTARAKGASERRIVWKHSLRGGLLSVVSFLGPAVSGIVTGSLVVELIFDIPGAARFFVGAAFNRDGPMLMGTTLVYAVLVVVMNLLADVVQIWMNPRLRFEE